MKKLLLVVLAILLVNAQNVTDNDVEQFIQGFGASLNLNSAASALVSCSENETNSLFTDIRDIIADLQDKNYTTVWDDFFDAMQDINSMVDSCPSGAEPFVQEFAAASAAYYQNRTLFLITVNRDLARDPVGAAEALISLNLALRGQDFYNVGNAFGGFAAVALSAYLNNTGAIQSNVTDNDAEQFIQGLGAALNLQSAANQLVNCSEVESNDLLSDVEALINDLQNKNYLGAWNDFFGAVGEINQMVDDCPAGAAPFAQLFGPAEQAYESNRTAFLISVNRDMSRDPVGVASAIASLEFALKGEDFYNVGNAFGDFLTVALASYLNNTPTAIQSNVTDNDAEQFIQGLGAALNLQSAANQLVNCSEVESNDLLSDVEALINDLQNKNYLAAWNDFFGAVGEINQMVDDCPAGAAPFAQLFGPAEQAYESNRTAFLISVNRDMSRDPVGVATAIASLEFALKGEDFYNVGNAFGDFLTIALASYLNNSELNIFEVVFAMEIEEPSGGTVTEFLDGYASVFGFEDAVQSLLVCVQSDASNLKTDVQDLISNLRVRNWTASAADMINVFNEIQALSNTCPQGALPFIDEFEPAFEELNNNSSEFWHQVEANIRENFGGLFGQADNLVQDLSDSDWYGAGADLANINLITLKGILPNDTAILLSSFSVNDTEALEFFEGFSQPLGLEQACDDLLNCAGADDSQLIEHLKLLIDAIVNHTNNTAQIISDFANVYEDIEALASNCPEGAEPYIDEFKGVFDEYNTNPKQFLNEVEANFKKNVFGIIEDLGQLYNNANAGNWNAVGVSTGSLVNSLLQGLLPNSTITY